jgi:ligand-binding sensor domain-containing protein
MASTFVTFDAENTPQFKSDTISDLLEDHSGNLWISTAAGLVSYRGGAFTAYTAARACQRTRCGSAMRTATNACGPSPRRVLRGSMAKSFVRWQEPRPRPPSIASRWRRMPAERSGWAAAAVSSPSTPPATKPQLALHLLSGVPVEAIELDRQGNCGSGTGEGLERYAAGTLVPVHLPLPARPR